MLIINGKKFDKKYSKPVGEFEVNGKKVYVREIGGRYNIACGVLIVNCEPSNEDIINILSGLFKLNKESIIPNSAWNEEHENIKHFTYDDVTFVCCLLKKVDRSVAKTLHTDIYRYVFPELNNDSNLVRKYNLELVSEITMLGDVLKSFVLKIYDYKKVEKKEM